MAVLRWLSSKFADIAYKIDHIVIPDPDLSALATEAKATENKEAIIVAMPTIPTDYAKETTAEAAKLTAQLAVEKADAAKTAAQANQFAIGTPAQGQPSTLFEAIGILLF